MNIKMDVEALLSQGLKEEDILKTVTETVKKNVAEAKKNSLKSERKKAKCAAMDKVTNGFIEYFDIITKELNIPMVSKESIRKEIVNQFNDLENMMHDIMGQDKVKYDVTDVFDDDILRNFLNKLR